MILKYIFVVFFSFALYNVYAQTDIHRHTINVGAGIGNYGSRKVDAYLEDYRSISRIKTRSQPVYFVSYDYALNRKISIGVIASYYQYAILLNHGNALSPYDSRHTLSIMNIAPRLLLHYNPELEKLDVYSGLRIGISTIREKYTTQEPIAYDIRVIDSYSKMKIGTSTYFTPQLVIAGMRYYFNEYVGINAEIGLGMPHIVTAGMSFRW